MMSRLMAAVYDRIMAESEAACLAAWRTELLADVSGSVLELGAGTGANLEHYRQEARVCLAEPNEHMRRKLEDKLTDARFEVADHAGEQLPYGADSFDAVVATLVLCSVDEPKRVLDEVYRVLKPGGAFIFIEHVGAERGSSRRVWQGRVEPVWKFLAGNCHTTRDTEGLIDAAGLDIAEIQHASMRRAPPWVRPSIRGVARKPRV